MNCWRSFVSLKCQIVSTNWEGSDDWVRAQCCIYLETFLHLMSNVQKKEDTWDLCMCPSSHARSHSRSLTRAPHSRWTLTRCTIEKTHTPFTKQKTIAALVDYNCAWVKAWMQTNNYKIWREHVDRRLLSELPLPTYVPPNNYFLTLLTQLLYKSGTLAGLL